jgi:hypothetical protein
MLEYAREVLGGTRKLSVGYDCRFVHAVPQMYLRRFSCSQGHGNRRKAKVHVHDRRRGHTLKRVCRTGGEFFEADIRHCAHAKAAEGWLAVLDREAAQAFRRLSGRVPLRRRDYVTLALYVAAQQHRVPDGRFRMHRPAASADLSRMPFTAPELAHAVELFGGRPPSDLTRALAGILATIMPEADRLLGSRWTLLTGEHELVTSDRPVVRSPDATALALSPFALLEFRSGDAPARLYEGALSAEAARQHSQRCADGAHRETYARSATALEELSLRPVSAALSHV